MVIDLFIRRTPMSDLTIAQIVKAIETLSPRIPLSVDLWSTREIAAYLKRKQPTVRDCVVTLPGFPQAIRLPAPVRSGNSTRRSGQALWKAKEVINWVEKHQEHRVV